MSTIIADDIRKRSIRLQRDVILERIRQEEEISNASIPKRFIIDAEEKARERVESQTWKKYMIVLLLVGSILWMGFRILYHHGKPIPSKKVRFNIDRRMELLKKEFPTDWKSFHRNGGPDWLISDITGKMSFEFFNPELQVGVDVVEREDLVFPSSKYEGDEIKFQNSVYNMDLKQRLCTENSFTYRVLRLDYESNDLVYESPNV